jgi:uncharacterized protein
MVIQNQGVTMRSLDLKVFPGEYSILKFPPTADIPSWIFSSAFMSITRAEDEISIVIPSGQIKTEFEESKAWRLLKLIGPFDFNLTGILASVLNPLAEEGIGIFALSTYNTDYVMVQSKDLDATTKVLKAASHNVLVD